MTIITQWRIVYHYAENIRRETYLIHKNYGVFGHQKVRLNKVLIKYYVRIMKLFGNIFEGLEPYKFT